MRVDVVLLSLLISTASCTTHGAPSQPAEPTIASWKSNAPPVWEGYGSVETQVAIRTCLDRERAQGDVNACVGVRAVASSTAAEPLPRILDVRQASWVAIDNWETVMEASLSWLRDQGPRDQVEVSQGRWQAAMLADIGLYMDMFEGGSMSGVTAETGAGIRADATIRRVLFLEKFRALLELNE